MFRGPPGITDFFWLSVMPVMSRPKEALHICDSSSCARVVLRKYVEAKLVASGIVCWHALPAVDENCLQDETLMEKQNKDCMRKLDVVALLITGP